MGAHDDHVALGFIGFDLDALGDLFAGALLTDALELDLDIVPGDLFPGLGQRIVGRLQRRFAQRLGVVVDGIVGQMPQRAVDDGDDAQLTAAQLGELHCFRQCAVGYRAAVHCYQNALIHDLVPSVWNLCRKTLARSVRKTLRKVNGGGLRGRKCKKPRRLPGAASCRLAVRIELSRRPARESLPGAAMPCPAAPGCRRAACAGHPVRCRARSG
ncbi:hypothetical protein D3C78_809710 [compost metagenome]